MEATIYEDQSFLLPSKNSNTQDKSRVWLSLPSDYKIPGRRDDFDISDLLQSPDIRIPSPDLETIVWRNFENVSARLPSFSSSSPLLLPQDDYSTQQVTAEQEVFARGFTDALQRLREEREVKYICKCETPMNDDSKKAIDDSKCTFIAYSFDSSQRLPSFQDTFSPVKISGTLISTTGEDVAGRSFRQREREQLEVSGDSDWFQVETLDEGFSGQQQCSFRECALNSHEDDSDDSTNSPSLHSPSSDYTTQEYRYADFDNEEDMPGSDGAHEHDDFETEEDWIDESLKTAQDTPTPKHWLTVHTKLYNMSVVKQEVETVDQQAPPSAMAADVQGFIKTERKRRRNRLAAWKCRQKKLIRESRLETTVEELCIENSRLMEELEKLKRKRQHLEQTFIKHMTSGCREAHVQYTQTFTGEN